MNRGRVRFGPGSLAGFLAEFPGTAKAWIAYSGGVDSTALLALAAASRELLKRPLAAVHVNHGAHPEAGQWAVHCRQVCRGLSVPLEVLDVTRSVKAGAGPEAGLREARYAALAELLGPGELLLTAHHRDDQAETLLLHLLRGSGIDGLAGMPRVRRLGAGSLLRPLLDTPRADLQAYLEASGLPWLADPSNDTLALDRNFIRHRILPLLEQRWPATGRTLARSAAHAGEASALLAEVADGLLGESGLGSLPLDPSWRDQPERLRLALRHWLRRIGLPPVPGAMLQEFCRQLGNARPDAATELAWSGQRLRAWQGRLWRVPSPLPGPCPATRWESGTHVDLGEAHGCLELQGSLPPQWPWALEVTGRCGGERLAAPGGGHRKVKEALRQSGIPPWLRAGVPLLAGNGEILAVGDWLLAPGLADWLGNHGLRLSWTPAHPALREARLAGRRAMVESPHGLG